MGPHMCWKLMILLAIRGRELGPGGVSPNQRSRWKHRYASRNACHGHHCDSVYSGSEHNQFDSPMLVKHGAGFPNPRRELIGSNQLWRVNDSPCSWEYIVLSHKLTFWHSVRHFIVKNEEYHVLLKQTISKEIIPRISIIKGHRRMRQKWTMF